jgi:hypothetical protein
MKKELLLAGIAALFVACGNSTPEPEAEGPPLTPEEYFEKVEAQGGSVPPPPPAPDATASAPAPMTNDQLFKQYNDGGEHTDTIVLLEKVVEAYEMQRSLPDVCDCVPNNNRKIPALTSLEQLVQFRFIRALPPAPEGQKFVLNPETGKVTLQPAQ